MAATINNVTDLQNMSNDLAADYELGCDIDATPTSGWNSGAGFAPIGTEASPFTGTFDGKGYTIRGLYISRSTTDYIGLFGCTTGSAGDHVTLASVKFTSATITGRNYVGILAGRTICTDITDVNCAGTVAGGASPYASYIGGMIGQAYNYQTINRCCSSGSVTGRAQIGGLVGSNYNVNDTIDNCYSTASVSCTVQSGGGLVGYNEATMDDCYSTGSVGGGGSSVNGFIGYNYDGRVTNCFWDTTTSEQATGCGGTGCGTGATGKTTAQMKTKSTFTDASWDFTTPIWNIASTINSGYPYLGASTSFWTTRSYTTPVVTDNRGRIPKGARAVAIREDTGEEINSPGHYLDSNGQVTFTDLPTDVAVTIRVMWGGNSANPANEREFQVDITEVSEGGTGASDTETAKANLGLRLGVNIQQYHARLTDISNITPTNGNFIVGDGTNFIAESGNTARTSLGLGTGDSPQFTGIELGHASDTTIHRVSAGKISVEGSDVLLEADLENPPTEDEAAKAPTSEWAYDHVAAADPHTGYIKHSLATAVSDFLVASGAGVFVKKTLAEVKTILGLGTAAYTAATDYVTHALATAASDFVVASGSGVFVKKTLAEVRTLLNWAADIATHAGLTTGVHGVGSYTFGDATSEAVTLYVDVGSGNDANPGTSGSPKATIKGALDSLPSTIAHAVTICVRGQQNYPEANVVLKFSRFNTLTYITIKAVNSSDEDMYDKGQADAGAGNNELDDATKAWSVDQFNGAYIWIYEGTGAGQVRTISDTTATKITVSANWTTNPDATSYYAIGGGATLTGTASRHLNISGKAVHIYGFKHTGATTYNVTYQNFASGFYMYNYDTGARGVQATNGVFTFSLWYNYIDVSTIGIALMEFAGGAPRANIVKNCTTSTATGIYLDRKSLALMSGVAGYKNYIDNCTKGIGIKTDSGCEAASSQVFNGCTTDIDPAVSTTMPQWYT